jgi:hypothetical protein
MQNVNGHQVEPRTWQVIAKELVEETNPERVLELSLELDRALDDASEPEAVQDGHAPDGKRRPELR